ncbi:hypothetical protein C8J57DRAFT_1660400, partial [Mycena rebaudengoi]
ERRDRASRTSRLFPRHLLLPPARPVQLHSIRPALRDRSTDRVRGHPPPSSSPPPPPRSSTTADACAHVLSGAVLEPSALDAFLPGFPQRAHAIGHQQPHAPFSSAAFTSCVDLPTMACLQAVLSPSLSWHASAFPQCTCTRGCRRRDARDDKPRNGGKPGLR